MERDVLVRVIKLKLEFLVIIIIFYFLRKQDEFNIIDEKDEDIVQIVYMYMY